MGRPKTDGVFSSHRVGALAAAPVINKISSQDDSADDRSISHDIFECSRSGDLRELKKILNGDQRSRVNCQDSDGLSPLHYATRACQLEAIDLLVKEGRADVNVADLEGATPLHYACRKKPRERIAQTCRDIIQYYLKAPKIEINAKDKYGSTPLHLAAIRNNDLALVELLSSKATNINAKDASGVTPLQTAVTYNNMEVTHLLLERGATVDISDQDGITALHLAAMEANMSAISLLMQHLPSDKRRKFIDATDKDGNNALHLAVENRATMVVEYLLDQGIPVDARCRWKTSSSTALHLASSGPKVIVKLLLEKGANPMLCDLQGETPLHKAVEQQNFPVVQLLLALPGAPVNEDDKEQFTPLLTASCYKNTHIVDALLKAGADVTIKENQERSPIILATLYNNVDVLESLLKSVEGTENQNVVDEADRFGNTALHVAAEKGFTEAFKILVRYGAYIESKNEEEVTPFHVAARHGHHRLLRLMTKITKFKCLNDEDEDSNTALHMAAEQGHVTVVKKLIEMGGDKEARNTLSRTPLDQAAENGHLNVVQLLLDEDVPVNPLDKDKTTPLHLACKQGHVDVVKLLLQRGADVSQRDNTGRNALDTALDHGCQTVATAIIQSDCWRLSLVNDTFIGRDHTRETPLRKMIRKMPDVAKLLFDRCIETGPKGAGTRDEDFWIEFNYEFIDDVFSNWRSERGLDNLVFQDDLYDTEHNLKDGAVPYTGNYTFLKRNHPLTLMSRYKREELLVHPLALSLIRNKWRVANILYLSFLTYFVIYVGFVTSYMVLSPPPFGVNATICDYPAMVDSKARFLSVAPYVIIALSVLGVIVEPRFLSRGGQYIVSVLGVIVELFELITTGIKYLKQATNLLDWFVYVSPILVVIQLGSCSYKTDWQWQLGAFAVFFTWLDMLLFLRRFPVVGIYVVMVVEIFKTFIHFFVVFFFFIVAFAFGFYILLQNQAVFAQPGYALIKTWVMMLGELDYGDIFHGETVYYETSTFILFVAFLVLVAIIVMNLLTGLAVDDVNQLQENARLQKLSMQVDLALDVEVAMPRALNRMRKCFIRKERYYPNRPVSRLRALSRSIEALAYPIMASEAFLARVLNEEQTDGGTAEKVSRPFQDLENRLCRRLDIQERHLISLDKKLDHLDSLLSSVSSKLRGKREKADESRDDLEPEGDREEDGGVY